MAKGLSGKLLSSHALELWELKGREISTGAPLQLLFGGSLRLRGYLAGIAFGGEFQERRLGGFLPWEVLRILGQEQAAYSAALIEGNTVRRILYQSRRDFFIPKWVRSSIDLPLVVSKKSAKDELRKIRKFELSYEITREREAFDHFYREMYEPTVRHRHGDSARMLNYESMLSALNAGICELLLIKRAQRAVAGLLIRLESPPRQWASGILGSDSELRKMGAGAATYWFAAEYLAGLGYTEVGLGSSRSFLSHGGLLYKKKWNHRIDGPVGRGFIFKLMQPSAGLTGFCVNNPFVYLHNLRGTKLMAAVFTPDRVATPEQRQRLQELYAVEGVKGVNLFHPDTVCRASI